MPGGTDFREEVRQTKGGYVLEDATFVDRVFTECVIGTDEGLPWVLNNVTFNRCKTSPGTALVLATARLSNVHFIDFDCGSELRIDTQAVLDGVTLQGDDVPKTLWIGPSMASEDEPDRQVNHSRYSLDISGYGGEVVIVGVPTAQIKIDPSRHIRMERARLSGAAWKDMGIGSFSFLKLCAGKLTNLNVAEGVFSLPPKTSSMYRDTQAGLERLKAAGLVD